MNDLTGHPTPDAGGNRGDDPAARLQAVLVAAHMATWRWDPETDDLIASDTLSDLFGLPPGAVLTHGVQGISCIHPADLEQLRPQVEALLTAGGSWHSQFRILRPRDGQIAWLEVRTNTVLNPQTGRVNLDGLLWDITERRRAEELLRTSEERLAAIFDSLPIGVGLFGTDGALLLANHEMRRFLPTGVMPSRDDARYDHWRGYDPEGRRIERDDYPGARALRGEYVLPGVEYRFLQDDGRETWTRVAAVPVRDGDGQVTGAVAVVADIDEAKQIADALATSEEQQKFLLRLSDALRPLSDPVAIQAEATRVLGEYLGACRVMYGEVAANGVDLIVERNYVAGDAAGLTGRYRMADFGPTLVAALAAGQGIALPDIASAAELSPTERAAYDALGIAALAGVPLTKDGQLVANLNVHHSAPHAWTANELALIEETAERTWAAVERARAEVALRASEVRFRILTDAVPQVIWTNDAYGRATYFNQRWYDYSGLSFEASVEAGWQTIVHPDDALAAGERWQYALSSGEMFEVECRLRRSDGIYRWHLGRNEPVRTAEGDLSGWFGSATDIEDLKQAEELLRKNELRQAFLLNLGDAMRSLTDPSHIRATAIRMLGEHLGVERVFYADIENRTDGDYFHIDPEYFGAGLAGIAGDYRIDDFGAVLFDELRAGHTIVVGDVDTETRLTPTERAMQKAVAVQAYVGVPLNKGGRLVAIFAAIQLTPYRWTGEAVRLAEEVAERTWAAVERARAEAALRESEERFRLMVEGARDYAMFLLDAGAHITYWTSGAERIFGWTEAEAIGQSSALIVTPEDRNAGQVEREIATALAEGSAPNRRWHLRKDGTRLFLDSALVRLDDASGRLRGFVKIGRDATEQRRAEEALQRARDELEIRVQERTAELQQLSNTRQDLLRRLVTVQEDERRRIARELHDSLGQFLSALNFRLSMLQQVASAPSELVQDIHDIRQLAGEIDAELERLTLELRPPALDDFGLFDAIRHYAAAWAQTAGIPVDVYDSGLGGERFSTAIETATYRIVQEALTNVLKHAGASAVNIVLERRRAELRIIIEDNGVGFQPEAIGDSDGGRRRLGLVGIHERALLAGGRVEIESAPGEGTTLYVKIPITPKEREGNL